MNREAQLLRALSNNSLSLDERGELVRELNAVRRAAAAKHQASLSIDFDAAAAHMTPVATYVRHTSDTDWVERVASHGRTAVQIHAAAKAEASKWFSSIHPQIVADRQELAIQATGMARHWAGQFGDDMRTAVASFLQQVSHLAGFKVAECDDESGDDGEDGDSNGDAEKSDPPVDGEDGEMEDDDDYDGPRKESSRRQARLVNVWDLKPGDVLLRGENAMPDPQNDTVEKVDGVNGMWIIDFTNGQSTPPLGNGQVHVASRRRTAAWTKTDQKGAFGTADVWQSDDPAVYAYVFQNSNSPRVRVLRSTPTGDAPGDGFVGLELITLPLPSRNVSDNEVRNLLEQEAKPSYLQSLSALGNRTASRIDDLIAQIEGASDFGADDEIVELNRLLSGKALAWAYGWGDRIKVITLDQAAKLRGMSFSDARDALDKITDARTASRRTADGQTCSVCGDKIAQTDGQWHHDNGEKHDHEAKPGGRTAARTAVSQEVAAASAFLGKLNEGDPVIVVIDGQEHQMAVSRRLSSGDPGGYGAMESSYVIVSFGPGRYSTNITVRQQASKSPGMPYIKDGTTASLRVGYTNSYGLSDEGPNGLRRGDRVWVEGADQATVLYVGFDEIANNLAINPADLGYEMGRDSFPVAVSSADGPRIVQFDALAPAEVTASLKVATEDDTTLEDWLSWMSTSLVPHAGGYADGITKFIQKAREAAAQGIDVLPTVLEVVKAAMYAPDSLTHDAPQGHNMAEAAINVLIKKQERGGLWTASKLGSIPGVGVGDKLVIQGGFEVIVTDADPQDGGPAGRVMARYIGDDIDMAVTADMIDRIVPAQGSGEQLSLMGARRSASVGQIVRDSGWSAPLKSAQGESQPRTRTLGVDALGQGKGNLMVTMTFDWPTYEVRVDPYPGKVVAKGETGTLGIIESAAMDWIKKNVTPEWYASERDKAVATASRRSAADVPSPSADSQNGYGESSLPDVTVPGAPEDTNLGWIAEGDPNAQDEFAFEAPDFPIANEASLHQAMPNPVDLGIQVGDIFYSSWGYDQTNVDFYQVVGLTGASVKVRQVAQRTVRSGGAGGDSVVAVPDHFVGEVMTKRIQSYSDRPSFNLNSYSDAYLWDGTPQYQTASGFGH